MSACLAMLLLAACGGEDGGDAPTLAGPLVYERSGGSTGDKSRVTLQPNGRATFATARRALQPQTDRQYVTELVDERSVKLDPAELERVSRQLREVDFAHLPARLLAPGEPIPDSCYGHTVTYSRRLLGLRAGKPLTRTRHAPRAERTLHLASGSPSVATAGQQSTPTCCRPSATCALRKLRPG